MWGLCVCVRNVVWVYWECVVYMMYVWFLLRVACARCMHACRD